MAVYCLAGKRCIDRHEFLDSHRLVSLQDNPYIPMLRALTGSESRPWRHEVGVYTMPNLCLIYMTMTRQDHVCERRLWA